MVSALAIPKSQKNSNVNKPPTTDRQLFSAKKDVEKKPPKNSQIPKSEPPPIPISIPSKSSDSNQFAKFAFGNSQSDSEKQFEEDQRIPFNDKASERATLRTPKPTGRNESRMEWLDDIRDSNGK
jgi:hypothetical protein